jgi:hypothetical protein
MFSLSWDEMIDHVDGAGSKGSRWWFFFFS